MKLSNKKRAKGQVILGLALTTIVAVVTISVWYFYGLDNDKYGWGTKILAFVSPLVALQEFVTLVRGNYSNE